MASEPIPGFSGDFSLSSTARTGLLAAGVISTALLARLASLDVVGANPLFHPHGYCYLWLPNLVGAHVVSDALIALSYLTISLTLVYLVRKARQTIPFSWMFLAFGTFIVACGATHLMEIVTLWTPLFWISADVKIVTAVASVATAVALPPLVPRILTMVSAARVSEARRVALERANDDLERRVAERTAQLSDAMAREQAARARAEEANRVKDDFLGIVSHELRTPLNAILGWSDMLSRRQLAPDAEDRALQSIQRSARVQAQVIDDLLDISRMSRGMIRLDRGAVEIESAIEAAIDTMSPTALARRVTIQWTRPQMTTLVSGDSNRLQQVIWNLLSNAVKFTPDGGTVVVTLGRRGRTAVIEVKDNGIGIDPGFLEYVFEPFRQADSSPARARSGLGLGLTLVRRLTELHGGLVRAESAGVGLGSTFTVELPLAETAVAPAAVRDDGSVPELVGIRVLVVDDDAPGLDLAAAVLRHRGAQVWTSGSVSDALEQLRRLRIDVIVSDIAMPIENGYDLLRRVRTDLALTAPAIALSAHARPEDRDRALAAGFQIHLAKPAAPDELVRAVAALKPSHGAETQLT